MIVEHFLIRHRHPDLFEESEQPAALEDQAKVRKAQDVVKSRISDMMAKDRSLTFSIAWQKLQKSNPELFEGFEEA